VEEALIFGTKDDADQKPGGRAIQGSIGGGKPKDRTQVNNQGDLKGGPLLQKKGS